MCLKKLYWTHQDPKVTVIQKNRLVSGIAIKLDIRNFFVNPDCWELQEACKFANGIYSGLQECNVVNNLLRWIEDFIESKPDKTEFWQLSFETLARRKGDCEDKAILLANLLRAAGFADWRVRLNAGDTSIGAHVWVTFYDGRKWIILDPSAKPAKYGEVFFYWTANQAYTKKENLQ